MTANKNAFVDGIGFDNLPIEDGGNHILTRKAFLEGMRHNMIAD